ncbi:ketosteroid isomerase-like protein [Kibdelosporangium banguiense]|uniref:Ketosteroid isomerase-like protein n=1 Tax=Kibdelosporangium banguiense TaxID=1365924 RepID=A0ABS4T6F3_9PSEU|nr:nuclear transport factor 2 family protein [Kibdelosporangium banguiense]MBP2320011.1 ketosteroid isomerase-like protein [Kibdelosporangium banguiense]
MTSQGETRIREIMAAKAAAMIDGDAKRIVAQYAPDIVKYDLAPPLRNVAPLDAEALASWFAAFDGPVDYEIRDLEVFAGEDLAYCHSLNRLSATPHGSPEQFDLWFRVTVCLRKIDGDWLTAHEHSSTPFYMDGSFGAALDLQP